MIDFRYHLVSLISVFLALAVGIVLGAGPLQGPIGSSLQSQVDALRTDRDTLRTELDEARTHMEQTAAFVDATASDLIADSLSDRSVTLVRLAGADNDAADAASARAEEAGGSIASDVSLDDDAFAAADAELLTALRDADDSLPEDDSAVMGAALAKALGAQTQVVEENAPASPADSADDTEESADSRQAASQDLFGILSDAERIAGGQWAEADAAVVIAPSLQQDAAAEPTPSATPSPTAEAAAAPADPVAIHADFSSALAGETVVVVAGPSASATGGLLATLRSDRVDLSTVDGTDLSTGPALIPLVVEAAIDGSFGDYGTAQGATAVLPERA
ncbi:copper transporter [Brevibacterium jeotgali]|uniref:Copper transport outer membrane protein, MctB n=1 Tax=Brevibacterium jeotgali TaxID=1262550 RepID=A0A2H1L7Y6_9MICO|nr:copper transporter [Brevibacterium jeotgali]TWC02593.1 copper transport outer membrane protein MctB [Brevibacterium jeotgali]SMY12503.1 Copper transport outer membrane protein, MctB [Brevibacterium jeotgali]